MKGVKQYLNTLAIRLQRSGSGKRDVGWKIINHPHGLVDALVSKKSCSSPDMALVTHLRSDMEWSWEKGRIFYDMMERDGTEKNTH